MNAEITDWAPAMSRTLSLRPTSVENINCQWQGGDCLSIIDVAGGRIGLPSSKGILTAKPAVNTQPKAIPKNEVHRDLDIGRNNTKFNPELHQAINGRGKEHFANLQAQRNVGNVSIPITNKVFQGHVINAQLKGNRATGGHTTLGNVRVDRVINEYPNGVYNAKISVFDPKSGQYKPKSNNNGESTMFPRHWTAERIKVEVDAAFKNKTMTGNLRWEGITPSGVKVRGFFKENSNELDTVYPLRNQ